MQEGEPQNQQHEVLQTIDQYVQELQLEIGGQGEVHLMSKQNKLYAVKIPLRWTNVNIFQRQQLIISRLNHPNIIKLVQYKAEAVARYENRENPSVSPALILQFADEGDLFYFSQGSRLSESVCRVLMGQIMSALKYIHEQNLMHLDMKTQNILVDKDFNLKISDFGFALYNEEIQQGARIRYGTSLFAPPEQNNLNGQKVDIFNTGIILFQLLFGRPPIQDIRKPMRTDYFYRLIINGNYNKFWTKFQRPPNILISNSAKRLIMQMLHQNPNQRLTIQQVFQHDWFAEIMPASEAQVTAAFLLVKQRLMLRQKKQLIQQIRQRFRILPQQQNNINLNVQQHNQQQNQANHRKNCHFYKRLYHDLINNKHAFQNIQQRSKNKFATKNNFKFSPSQLFCMYSNVVDDLIQSGQQLLHDEFFKFKCINHLIQLVEIQRGALKATFEYELQNLIDLTQEQQKQQQGVEQQENTYMKIMLEGQIIKREQTYNVEWSYTSDMKENLWKRQLMQILNRISLDLLEDSKQKLLL